MSFGLEPRERYRGLHGGIPQPPSTARLLVTLVLVVLAIWYLSRMT